MKQLPLILVCLSIIVLCLSGAIVAALVWDKVPWWRSHGKPSRQLRDDRERVRDWKLRQRHPEAFDSPMPPQEAQHARRDG